MVLLSIDFASLHTILESLYNEMMLLCEDMLGVAKGVAGLGALFYVALRVWQSMVRAEPVDVYPLPFCTGYLYPAVSDTGAGNDEQYFKSHCAGDP